MSPMDTLSDDLQYPECPDCDKNRTGLFTEVSKAPDLDWTCVKCGRHFDLGGEIRPTRGPRRVPEADPL